MIFGSARWDAHRIENQLRTLALLRPGLTIDFNVEPRSFGPVNDLTDLFEEMLGGGAPVVHEGPFLLSRDRGPNSARIALGWQQNRWSSTIRSFCNFRETEEGGSHVLGIKEGLRRTFGDVPPNKLMDGLLAVVHVTM